MYKTKRNFILIICGLIYVQFSFLSETVSAQLNTLPADTSKVISPIRPYSQDTYNDLNAVYPMDAPNPDNVRSVVEYDPVSGLYVLRTYVGENEITTPYAMTQEEYYDYSSQQAMWRYWREKELEAGASNEDKFSLTDMKFDIGKADKIFGPGGVQVKMQGSAELRFGIRHSRVDNPSANPRARKNTSPDFEQKIQLNVNASVGSRINFTMNYNTESTFSFDQKMLKLAYQGEEDDIIQSIEAGNVSMQLNTSLINGSSTLFGVKTDLKFGKLNVSAIVTQQKSESQRVSSRGGTQTTEFEINVDEYEENRHFFISHYHRNNFEKAMSRAPFTSSSIKIQNIEVWVTNKQGATENTRNIAAFMDLAETDSIYRDIWERDLSRLLPENESNTLYGLLKGVDDMRNIQKVNEYLLSTYPDLIGGEDYEKVENARMLRQGTDYTFNEQLGIISLRYSLNADEVIAVAYEYTNNGKTSYVGELTSDKKITSSQVLLVKLLKASTQVADIPMWHLMMKNVYNLGSTQVQEDNFKLDIIYRNDSIGTDLKYLTEGNIKNQILLRVMNLDRLDQRKNVGPDGKFDFLEGYTINTSTGRIMFPVLEPFGKHLRQKIGDDAIADKYVFEELYTMTLIEAQEYSDKNKFRLVGEYKGSSGKEIRLNAMNVPRGSVVVTAAGERLIEGQDYTVDYTMGTVTITNQSLIESNATIDVQLENQSTFNLQRKTLLGTHLEYEFNKNLSVGGTLMYMKETPLTTKVNTGNEPISNTIWGLNAAWRGESQWLTNVINKLPFVNATQPSTFAVNAEFAQLIPGHPKVIGESGYAYIDDFESTKTSIDMHYTRYWKLSSTPSLFPESAHSDSITYGFNRALLAWYEVDPYLNSNTKNAPAHIRNNKDLQSNHYTRNVYYEEIYPNREILSTQTSALTVMNLSFYPNERGPYNLDQRLNPDGTLQNPTERWGGIMRSVDYPDFENSNIEYIEFWLLDPFIYNQNHNGGELYIDLGDVSEDILKDGRKFFENGLDINGDFSKNDSTVWGYVPKGQSTVNAFTSEDRQFQDVGLNGLRTVDEFRYPAYRDYLIALESIIDPVSRERMQNDPFSPFNDPAGDNFHHYRGDDYDAQELDILARYKRYNGTEGNSAVATSDGYSTSATIRPDTEDLNNDNTLNEYEKYFQYRIPIKKESMVISENTYITDIVEASVKLPNGSEETVKWYQFKVPLSDYLTAPDAKVATPRNFKSIRFMRMFLTNFQEDIHLRFATLEFIRGEWRTYTKTLHDVGVSPISEGKLDVLAVNIEENASKSPVNYVLPPGISRQTTPGQVQVIPQNEQAMVMRVTDLAPKDARAVYKKTNYDMRQYKRLQMFVHAERLEGDITNLSDQELTCFIRLGSDMTNNYYEYEIPLVLTPEGKYSNQNLADRYAVWPQQNMFDFPFKVLTNAKLERNKMKQVQGSGVTNTTPYVTFDPEKQTNKVTIVGNPSISEVRNIMIGVRNNSNNSKSGEIWVNELRMSEFDEDGGWAAMGNFAMALSDIATVNVAGRTETAGFGSVESSVLDRNIEDIYQISVATSADLGRFLPEKAKFIIPFYFSYSNETYSPKYNPLDEDILLSDALDLLETKRERDSLKNLSQTVLTTKSFNITNAKLNQRGKKRPMFYDPANVSMTFAYSESKQQTPDIERDLIRDYKIAWDYGYSFGSEPFEPFKNTKGLDKPAFKIIKDFNIYYLPTSVALHTQMNRQFTQIVYRDFTEDQTMYSDPANLTFSKDFLWTRSFNINYNLTRSLSLSLQAATNANIIETQYTPEIGREYYENWRDTVWSSIKKGGRPYSYQQTFNATWNIPINKLPLFSWTTANASYNANYIWDRTADIDGEELGNIASSISTWQIGGQLNFEQLYNKVTYFQQLETRLKQKGTRPKFQSKTYTETVSLKEGEVKTINHRLGSERVRLSAKDSQGRLVNVSFTSKSPSAVEVTANSALNGVELTIVSQDPNWRSPGQQVLDFSSRLLLLVRRGSITYRESNSLTVPGFMNQPEFLGQSKDGILSPGLGFAFGFFDEKTTVPEMKDRGWLWDWQKNEQGEIDYSDQTIYSAIYTNSTDLDLKASLEPIMGLKIELNAKRITQYNKTIEYMVDGYPTNFTGNYSMTQVAIKTAFRKFGNEKNDYNSKTYNTFLANREIIQNRLNQEYYGTRYPNSGFLANSQYAGKDFDPNEGFTETSPEVLIPAFLSAYTGKNPNKIKTDPFLKLASILPNWRITYDGLTRIPWIKERFRSVSLTHAYICQYTIGSYSTHSSWVSLDGDGFLGYMQGTQDAEPIPSMQYNIPSVTLSEQFSPLIGVNVALTNTITTKVEYRKQRNLTLNLSSYQLVDGASDEIVVGFGYTIKEFNLFMRSRSGAQTAVKNDLKLNVDVSYKDNKMLLRKIDEGFTQATSGNKVFGVKVMADYVFSTRVNLQMYFEHSSASPLISTSYPTSNTLFGVAIKFMLTR